MQDTLRKLDCFSALDEVRLPVVCAIQGGCVGGALDLATAYGIRVCSDDAFFTVQEVHIGMMTDLGVLQRLAKIDEIAAAIAAWKARQTSPFNALGRVAQG